MNTSDIIATLGVTLLLLAFFLQSIKAIDSAKPLYHWLNFIGAAIAGYASWLIPFVPFVVLECVWAGVALFSLIRIYITVSRETKNKRTN